MKKKFLLIVLACCIHLVSLASDNNDSHWLLSCAYRNSFTNFSDNHYDVGIGYSFKDKVTLNAYTGLYLNSIVSGVNYGFFSEVYPLNFFSEKPRKLSPYLKLDYGWLSYGFKGERNLNRFSGFGYYVGAKYPITKKISVFMEVGKGARFDYSVGLKYRF